MADQTAESRHSPASKHRLARVTVADQVRDYLVVEITQGRLAPGDSIREMDLAQKLGVSQTPVREALHELAALGLIESRRHVGARVRHMAEQDLINSVPVRAALEGLAGRFAAAASSELKEGIRRAFEGLGAAAAAGDPLAYANASTAFHRSVIRASGNDALERAWNSLGIEVMTIMATTGHDASLMESAESHREIVEAVETGDPELAQKVLIEHQDHYLPVTRANPANSK